MSAYALFQEPPSSRSNDRGSSSHIDYLSHNNSMNSSPSLPTVGGNHSSLVTREALAAKATRKFLRERYRRTGKIFLLATVVVLLFMTPIFYIVSYREATQDLNRFLETTCTLTDKSFREKEFKNLCPLTTNYILK